MFQRNDLLDFENFLKKCPTERPADRGISRPAGREHFADCGTSSVITFWTLSKFQNISKSAVGRESASRSRPASRETFMSSLPTADFGNFDKVQKVITLEDPHRRVVLDLPVENDRRSAGLSSGHFFKKFSKSKRFQSPQWEETPHEGLLDWQVENDSPIADLPA